MMTDKIKAVALGHAIGDAIGVPVEFCDRSETDESPVTDMMGYGTYPYPEGTWSDDTSMSLCTLDNLHLPSEGMIYRCNILTYDVYVE